jgi:outer membrane protein assembly factor BamE (lipoprotein component of BamABCDE complex)
MRSGVDHSSMVAMVLLLALAGLTVALIVIKRIVRNNDVIRGDYVDNDEEDR